MIRPTNAAIDSCGSAGDASFIGPVDREILPAIDKSLCRPIVPIGKMGTHVSVLKSASESFIAQVSVQSNQVVCGFEREGCPRPSHLRVNASMNSGSKT